MIFDVKNCKRLNSKKQNEVFEKLGIESVSSGTDLLNLTVDINIFFKDGNELTISTGTNRSCLFYLQKEKTFAHNHILSNIEFKTDANVMNTVIYNLEHLIECINYKKQNRFASFAIKTTF